MWYISFLPGLKFAKQFGSKEINMLSVKPEFVFLDELFTKSFFSNVDVLFSNNLNPQREDEAIFLSYLFLISRSGYISLRIDDFSIYPKPKDLDFDNLLEHTKQKELIEKIISGSKKFSIEIHNFTKDELFPKYPIWMFKNYYYLQKNYVFETIILKNLKSLISAKPQDLFLNNDLFSKIDNEKTLNHNQKDAIKKAYSNCISLITGGPGTGKTHVASHLIKIFMQSLDKSKKFELKIAAAAFTGKATSILKSKVEGFAKEFLIDIKTIHNLLNIKEGRDKYFDESQLDYDLLIIDEASMLDFRLMAYLLHSIKKDSRIVFIGDSNQLPPIASGNIFAELSNIQNLVTYLDLPVRFENQKIIEIAEMVKQEEELKLFSLLGENIFFNHESLDMKSVIFEISKYKVFQPTFEEEDIDILFTQINDFKILSSIKSGPWGIDAINFEALTYFFEKANLNDYLYIPIIITKNNYKTSLYNGQIGIAKFQVKSNKLSVFSKADVYFKIDDKIIHYPIASLKYYELAYAISIHKSQGSEFDNAIIILPEGSQNFGRELLYTAVTRVKRNLKIFSAKSILLQLLKKSSLKKSGFLERYLSFS